MPDSGEPRNAELVNLGTFVGALGFLVGALPAAARAHRSAHTDPVGRPSDHLKELPWPCTAEVTADELDDPVERLEGPVGDRPDLRPRRRGQRGAPTHDHADDGMRPDTAYQVVHDELMLDGNARLNLATFVTTWMEPQAEKLMAETFDKNMIDKDEYPRTADLEMRCVNMLARLWNSPDEEERDRDVDDGIERGGDARRHGAQVALARPHAAGREADRQAQHGDGHQRPGVLGEVLPLLGRRDAPRPDGGRPVHLNAEEAVKRCDENTIGVVPILGSTFDGSYEPIEDICKALDKLENDTGLDVPVHVDGASGAFIAPFIDPDVVWDFRLPRVQSINASGHKYGLVYPGVGWVVWRNPEALPEDLDLPGELPRWRDADVLVELLATRQPDRGAVLQLHPARVRRLPPRAAGGA